MKSHSFIHHHKPRKVFLRGSSWYVRYRENGSDRWLSTRTGNLEKAIERAHELLDTGEPLKRPAKPASVGDVIAAYEQWRHVKTPRDNTNSLRRVIAAGRIMNVDPLPVSALSFDTVRNYFRVVTGKTSANQVDFRVVHPKNYAANSTVRQAKSVFSRRALKHYEEIGLAIPASIKDFTGAELLKQAPTKFTPLSREELDSLQAGAEELKDTDTELWLVHTAIKTLGLRCCELEAARGSWLTQHDGKWFLDIRPRPEEGFATKANNAGKITVPATLVPWFLARREQYLILPFGTEYQRSHLIRRKHSQWLRRHLAPHRRDTNHALRKHAGSVVAQKTNSWEAAARFLRNDLATAKAHYLELLSPVGLEETDWTT